MPTFLVGHKGGFSFKLTCPTDKALLLIGQALAEENWHVTRKTATSIAASPSNPISRFFKAFGSLWYFEGLKIIVETGPDDSSVGHGEFLLQPWAWTVKRSAEETRSTVASFLARLNRVAQFKGAQLLLY